VAALVDRYVFDFKVNVLGLHLPLEQGQVAVIVFQCQGQL